MILFKQLQYNKNIVSHLHSVLKATKSIDQLALSEFSCFSDKILVGILEEYLKNYALIWSPHLQTSNQRSWEIEIEGTDGKVSFAHKQIITLQKFNIPISIDISVKTHQFVCIRQALSKF